MISGMGAPAGRVAVWVSGRVSVWAAGRAPRKMRVASRPSRDTLAIVMRYRIATVLKFAQDDPVIKDMPVPGATELEAAT
jgi:hypothetical protein